MNSSSEWTTDKVWRIVFHAVLIVGVLLVARMLSTYLIPFFLAYLVAYILDPVVRFFRYRLHFRYRSLSVFATLALFSLFFYGLTAFLCPVIKAQVREAVQLIDKQLQNPELTGKLPETIQTYLFQINSIVKSNNINLWDSLSKIFPQILTPLQNYLSQLGSFLFALLGFSTFFLYLFFIMFYYEGMSSQWRSFLPPLYREKLVQLVHDVEREMRFYFRGQTQIVAILMVLFSTGFLIAGLPLAVPLGLLTGFLNFIPYLQWVALAPALLLGFLESLNSPESFNLIILKTALVFIIVQTIQEMVLIPVIMKRATGLRPPIILLSLSVWGGLLGFTGLLIAIPLTSLIIHYYKIYILKGNLLGRE